MRHAVMPKLATNAPPRKRHFALTRRAFPNVSLAPSHHNNGVGEA